MVRVSWVRIVVRCGPLLSVVVRFSMLQSVAVNSHTL